MAVLPWDNEIVQTMWWYFGPHMTMSFQQNEIAQRKQCILTEHQRLTSLGIDGEHDTFCYGDSFSNGMLSDIWDTCQWWLVQHT